MLLLFIEQSYAEIKDFLKWTHTAHFLRNRKGGSDGCEESDGKEDKILRTNPYSLRWPLYLTIRKLRIHLLKLIAFLLFCAAQSTKDIVSSDSLLGGPERNRSVAANCNWDFLDAWRPTPVARTQLSKTILVQHLWPTLLWLVDYASEKEQA